MQTNNNVYFLSVFNYFPMNISFLGYSSTKEPPRCSFCGTPYDSKSARFCHVCKISRVASRMEKIATLYFLLFISGFIYANAFLGIQIHYVVYRLVGFIFYIFYEWNYCDSVLLVFCSYADSIHSFI